MRSADILRNRLTIMLAEVMPVEQVATYDLDAASEAIENAVA